MTHHEEMLALWKQRTREKAMAWRAAVADGRSTWLIAFRLDAARFYAGLRNGRVAA